MNRKTLLLSASALLLALPVIAAPVATSFAGGDVINVKAEAGTAISINSCPKAYDNSGNDNQAGPFYRFSISSNLTNNTYTGSVFDSDLNSYAVNFVKTGDCQYDIRFQTASEYLKKLIIKKDVSFVATSDSTDTFTFDKDYLVTYGSNWGAATVAEYSGTTETVKTITAFDGNGKTINRETEDKNANSSENKNYRIYVTLSVTAYGDVYNGSVYDVSGKEYAVTLKNMGSSTLDDTARHKFDVKFTEWTNHFIISKDTRFVKSDDKNTILKFEDDYFVTFEGDGALPVLATKTAIKAEADQFVTNFMHPDIATTDTGSGLCAGETGYYATAKTAYEALSNGAKILFQNDSSYSDMKARYTAWAAANGDNGSKSGIRAVVSDDGTNYVIPTVAALALGLGASAALVLFAKRKKQEK